VQHPQLRHRAQLVLLDGSAHAVAGLDHLGGPGRARPSSHASAGPSFS
jgi:hypothetical protein